MNLKSGFNINGYLLETKLSDANHLVWLAYEVAAERDVVLKFIEDKKSARRERILMVDIDHPNIIKLLTVFQYMDYTVLVLEYKPGENLKYIWKDLEKKACLQILLDVASALDAIHQAGLWHGDVSYLNVLYYKEKNKAYLIDFAYEGKCAVGFQAPEDFDDNPHQVNSQTDVFRFGKLIELLRPDLVFRFQSCFSEDPAQRPSVSVLLKKLSLMQQVFRYKALAWTASILLTLLVTFFILSSQLSPQPAPAEAPGQQHPIHSPGTLILPVDSGPPIRILASYHKQKGTRIDDKNTLEREAGQMLEILSDSP